MKTTTPTNPTIPPSHPASGPFPSNNNPGFPATDYPSKEEGLPEQPKPRESRLLHKMLKRWPLPDEIPTYIHFGSYGSSAGDPDNKTLYDLLIVMRDELLEANVRRTQEQHAEIVDKLHIEANSLRYAKAEALTILDDVRRDLADEENARRVLQEQFDAANTLLTTLRKTPTEGTYMVSRLRGTLHMPDATEEELCDAVGAIAETFREALNDRLHEIASLRTNGEALAQRMIGMKQDLVLLEKSSRVALEDKFYTEARLRQEQEAFVQLQQELAHVQHDLAKANQEIKTLKTTLLANVQ